MKNKMVDVRSHLVAIMERLGDENLSPEKLTQTIEVAKATTLVANQYISAVKTEIEAIKVASEMRRGTTAVTMPEALEGSVQAIGHERGTSGAR